VVAPALLNGHELVRIANWSPAVIGFCLFPLLLRWPTARAAATLCAYWAVPAAINLLREASQPMLVFVGFSFAGSLIPQLFVSLFSSWAFAAGRAAQQENDAQLEVVTAEKIAEAIQTDYFRRYADVMERVGVLLHSLAGDAAVTPEIRRHARAETRHLRALFDELRTDHPLLFEICTRIDAAEDRGVEVTSSFDGELPALAPPDVSRIVAALDRQLRQAATRARVVVTGTDEVLSISVVCEVAENRASGGEPISGDGIEVVSVDGTTWMTIRYPAAG
jgi:hypothetical protein